MFGKFLENGPTDPYGIPRKTSWTQYASMVRPLLFLFHLKPLWSGVGGQPRRNRLFIHHFSFFLCHHR